MLETHVMLCVAEPDFLEKKKLFYPKKLGKWTKNGSKTGFYEFSGNFGHQYLLILFYNKKLCYLLCSSTGPIFEKNVCF